MVEIVLRKMLLFVLVESTEEGGIQRMFPRNFRKMDAWGIISVRCACSPIALTRRATAYVSTYDLLTLLAWHIFVQKVSTCVVDKGWGMIWIGTSGWVYPHWVGRFYPMNLPVREHLAYYARHFPTVEINSSFYRLPTREQFQAWSEQTRSHPGFRFAVKASRYLTHMKKLLNAEEGAQHLLTAAEGLGTQAGPFLYQLPPHWRADPGRLEHFLSQLPHERQAAFEFRDPSWFQPEIVQVLADIFAKNTFAALARGVGGALPTPLDLPLFGSFGYVRVHNGATGVGLSDAEIASWAERLAREAVQNREVYVYFNNDPEGNAIRDAFRLRERLGGIGALLTQFKYVNGI